MMKRKSNDLRRIRPTAVYTVAEAAKVTQRCVKTIRRWIGTGLPVIDDVQPAMIEGRVLLSWLKQARAKGKRPCAQDELYCFRCNTPRKAVPGTAILAERTSKVMTLRARCSHCDGSMVQAVSVAKVKEKLEALNPSATGMKNMLGFNVPNVDVHKKPPRKRATAARQLTGQLDLFQSPAAPAEKRRRGGLS